MKNKKVTVKQFLDCIIEYKNSCKPLVISIDTYKGYNISYTVNCMDNINGIIVLSNNFDYSQKSYSIKDIINYISNYNENSTIKLEIYSIEDISNKTVIISRDLLDNSTIYESNNYVTISVK